MYSAMNDLKKCTSHALFTIAATLMAVPVLAADFNCTGPQMGEIFIDTTSGNITKGAEETLTVKITTENSLYRFEFKGKKSQFKAIINRANGQLILDEACTPECWGGPIFGTCTPIKAKL